MNSRGLSNFASFCCGLFGVMLASGGVGCGGAASRNAMRPSSPFTAQDALVFEDGVDFVSDPGSLTGRWADDWDRDLRGRAAGSDLIGLVKVDTLATQVDPQQRTTFRLAVRVTDAMKGEAPADLALVVSEDSAGYSSIEPGRARLVSEQFVLFAKWYAKPDGTVGSHWHLTIASPQVTARVHSELTRNEAPKRTVIKTNVVKE